MMIRAVKAAVVIDTHMITEMCGWKCYLKENELCLAAAPGGAESAVVGVPDPDLGEIVVAFLVGKDLDLMSIKDYLGKTLARFKHPKEYVVVETLPRNTMGKILKAHLRTSYQSRTR